MDEEEENFDEGFIRRGQYLFFGGVAFTMAWVIFLLIVLAPSCPTNKYIKKHIKTEAVK